MNNWNKVSDFVIFSTKGITPKYVEKSNVIVLNQKCIRNNIIDYSFSQFTDDSKITSDSKFVQKGDILINSTGAGTAGRSAFVKELPKGYKVITDSHILLIRCKSYNEAKCLSYVLFSFEKTLMSFMTGSSGQSELDKVVLFDLKTNMPTDEQSQQYITNILFKIERKIELNNKINAHLETLSKTLYDYWFVQFDFPNEYGKPYKSSGGKMVWNEELKREIPEGWEVCKLGEIGNFKNGVNYDPSNPGDVACPIINVRNISSSSYFIKNEDLDVIYLRNSDVKKYAVHNGSIIIARSGIPGATRLIADIAENTLYCGFAIHYVLDNLDFKIPVFFYLKSIEYQIQNGSGGTIMKNVNQATLNALSVCLPKEKNLLENFNKLIQPIFDKISLIQIENQKLVELRDWLLPMLMNGQVKVN